MVNLPFVARPLLDLSAGKLVSVLLGLSLCLQTMAFVSLFKEEIFSLVVWSSYGEDLPKFVRLSSSGSNLASLTNFKRDPLENLYRIYRDLQSWNIHFRIVVCACVSWTPFSQAVLIDVAT